MRTSQEIYEAAFSGPRDKRSDEYKAGVLAALLYRENGQKIVCPWPSGSSMADAYFSGLSEGYFLWRCSCGQER